MKVDHRFSAERWDRAIWFTVLEARSFARDGDHAESERLLDLAANSQMELDQQSVN
jgi:hypothetical protein